MEDRPTTIRIYPGELRPVYYTSVLASHTTTTLEVIRLALERLQIYEDKTLYDLYEGRPGEEEKWNKLTEEQFPVVHQEHWRAKDTRFFLKRKHNASLVLAQIVSQYILPEGSATDISDLCRLEELSENTMLSNLKARFSDKSIYTYAGSILIAVNPYYFYPIYNPKYTALYQGRTLEELPPHIFAVADRSYHAMLSDRENQTVIISGESGAGKTESTKFLLHHLMSLSAKMDETQSLELITLGTGPVLEAFGNARTVANNNSSRFGKFIQVQFKENGAYFGATIEKYLLEKSRIISQAQGERNYHVFYYLLAGADPDLRRKLKLLQMKEYRYLTQGAALAPVEGVEEYHRLRQSLTMLSFSEQIQMSMFTVLSAILHIGNVGFRKKDGEETVQIHNVEAISVISKLLQVHEQTLTLALTTKKSKAGGADFFITPYKMDEAVAARDSLAKALYGSLFDWIVDQVNISLASSSTRGHVHKGHFIGVLDIFGFEVFQKNSFEQFCINYANEQLQQYFNKHIFKLEQAEYAVEGIEWSSVSFVDNQECLDLIAKKPTGLLPLLDEECSFPGADDHTLFQKFERQHKAHPHYRTPQMRLKNPVFTIVHYASSVTYSVQGFREKNRDLMRQDIINVLRTSHMDLVRALIGLPPYAVHRWHMAYLKVIAAFAFRKAGKLHKLKREGLITPSFQHKLRRGSTPPVPFTQHDGPGEDIRSRHLRGGLIEAKEFLASDSFAIEHGRLKKPALGIRTSRSYDLLSDAANEEKRKSKGLSRSSSKDEDSYMAYGISPRFPRRYPDPSPVETPDSPTFFLSPPGETLLETHSAPNTLPHSPSPLTTPPKSQEISGPPASTMTPPMSTPQRPPPKERQLHKQESRSRLPSISHLQEKLRKRWPRTLRLGGGGGEVMKEKQKYWKTTPRMRDINPMNDPRLLHTLARAASTRQHGPFKTVSGQFQVSLIALMETLEKTSPHFVRCIKSNKHKAPCQFDEELVLRQLRYTGMVETVKIRKAGYSVRMAFEDFYEKYQFLMGVKSPSLAEQIDQFLRKMDFTSDHFQVGTSKVFMREAQKHALEDELREKVLARIVIIQRWTRAKLLRCRFLHMRRSAIIIQSAIRGWLARIKVDELRLRVCKAVEVQAAWRGFVVRKRFIRLKQAAIILQAHWRGQLARRMFIVLLEEKRQEEERLRQEQERRREEERRRREEEEEKRRVEEDKRREEDRLLEEERRKQQLEKDKQAREEAERPTKTEVIARRLQAQDPSKRDSSAIFLDTEVSDVLFHFDTIVSELERSTLEGSTPRSLSPNEPLMQASIPAQTTKTHGSDVADEKKLPGKETDVSTITKGEKVAETPLTNGEGEEVEMTTEAVRKSGSVQPKIRVRDIQQQFLHSKQSSRESSAPSRDALGPGLRGNVKSLIAQMQSVSRESSTTPEPEMRETHVRQNRPRSASITQRISMLTQTSVENDVFEKKEPAPVLTRRISELAHDYESRIHDKEDSKATTPPVQRKKVQSPFISPPSKTTDDLPREISRSRSPQQLKGHVKFKEPDTTEEANTAGGIGLEVAPSSGPQEVTPPIHPLGPQEDEHSTVEVHPPAMQKEGGEATEPEEKRELVSNGHRTPTSPILSPTLVVVPAEEAATQPSPAHSVETPPASVGKPGADSRVQPAVPEEMALSPPPDQPYRFRSISDVSHNTRMLTSYRTESSINTSTSEQEDESLGPLSESCAVPHHEKKKKRNIVSVADPTDIISNLHLAHIPLEGSSELTRGLSPEDVHRLNQKRERMRSPSDRLKLFSFSKRHLRLPFGKGRSKREKQGSAQEKTSSSPKRKGSKHDSSVRNKRLSRAQADQLLAHNFIPTPAFKGPLCGVCHKGFTGFMKHTLQCADCGMMIHRHCDYRTPPCKAQIESGSYVTMSRKKVVKELGDLDDLAQFLLHKISMLTKEGSANSKVDRVFEAALFELHASLVSNYSLTLQKSLEVSDQQKEGLAPPSSSTGEHPTPAVTITFAQLVNNFTNVFKGIAKRHGLSDPCHVAISINQMKTFLDEFSKGRRHSAVKAMSGNIEPATLRRKTFSGRDLELLDHNGHRFFTEQFKVATVCEFCNDPIPLLEKGEVCQVCGYTCHETCLKLTASRCEGKERAKSPPASKLEASQPKRQFGVPLHQLVPQGSSQVPTVLEKCLQYIENHGLYVQGIYRKSPGASSKRAVKATLEEDPQNCSLDGFHVNAVAAAVGTFFRELPEPLLTKELYIEFTRTIDLTDREERLETLHHLIGRLPELNHAVFERLIFHLARVAQQECTNKMTPYNLAVIFAPCLFQGDSKNPQDLLKDLAKQTICLELIIEEQVEKLNATLRGIETLSVVARDTASKLTELIGADESSKAKPSARVSGGSSPVKPVRSPSHQTTVVKKRTEEEEERQRLTSELHEIERERVELTVNLPKLEPFTRDHHASWVMDSRESTPVLELEDKLPPLPTHSLLPALTKHRVSKKPKARLPSRRTVSRTDTDGSDIDTPQH